MNYSRRLLFSARLLRLYEWNRGGQLRMSGKSVLSKRMIKAYYVLLICLSEYTAIETLHTGLQINDRSWPSTDGRLSVDRKRNQTFDGHESTA